MSKSKMIVRTKFIDRACHWTVVICFFLVALSGISFFFPTLQWLTQTFGTPQMGRILHPFFGIAIFVALMFMFVRFVHHNIPDKKDIPWLLNIVEVLKGNEHKVADVGKYNAGQKMMFWSIMSMIFVLLVTGVIIWRPYFAQYFPMQVVRYSLLDTLIAQLIALLQRDKSRKFIAQQIVRWLESEHPLKAKILPTEWLGEHSAELVSDAVNSLLDDISRDRAHQIRYAFDRATFALIDKLKNDPEMAARADAVKSYLKEDEAFNRYLSELWGDLREWLKADINSEDSRVKERIARAGQWFGETLIADDALRASLNGHLEQAAHRVAPEFSAFLTRHISDTVKSWDARDMSRQIELNIGKDLQFIRVNGTLVGGCIGLILYLLSQLPALFPLGNF